MTMVGFLYSFPVVYYYLGKVDAVSEMLFSVLQYLDLLFDGMAYPSEGLTSQSLLQSKKLKNVLASFLTKL